MAFLNLVVLKKQNKTCFELLHNFIFAEESEDENFDEDDGMFQEDEEGSPALDQDSDEENDDENSVCLFSDVSQCTHQNCKSLQ